MVPALAMPPAPPGPYQSMEDGFIKAKPVSTSSQSTQSVAPNKPPVHKNTQTWNWSTPQTRQPLDQQQLDASQPASFPPGAVR